VTPSLTGGPLRSLPLVGGIWFCGRAGDVRLNSHRRNAVRVLRCRSGSLDGRSGVGERASATAEVIMHKLVLLRHGESVWNKENIFTGWTDVDLSAKGVEEARQAGRTLRELGFTFDVAHTSVLKRAIRTLWIALDEMDLMWIPVHRNWRLNERHYGALQGLNKSETAARHGEDMVKIWRRSYTTPPPALDVTDPRYPGNDRRYASLIDGELPRTEALCHTVARFLPYWRDVIAPAILSGQRVLIAAHGNSLRALVKHLDSISDQDIVELNIPTGIPLVYELDEHLKPLRHEYLGDPEEVNRKIAAVAGQGKKA